MATYMIEVPKVYLWRQSNVRTYGFVFYQCFKTRAGLVMQVLIPKLDTILSTLDHGHHTQGGSTWCLFVPNITDQRGKRLCVKVSNQQHLDQNLNVQFFGCQRMQMVYNKVRWK